MSKWWWESREEENGFLNVNWLLINGDKINSQSFCETNEKVKVNANDLNAAAARFRRFVFRGQISIFFFFQKKGAPFYRTSLRGEEEDVEKQQFPIRSRSASRVSNFSVWRFSFSLPSRLPPPPRLFCRPSCNRRVRFYNFYRSFACKREN